jgi:catechol 2,3-dioxygenase-like lactoylglutathione lyase family enzyme
MYLRLGGNGTEYWAQGLSAAKGTHMIIDHIGLAVSDYDKCKTFFTQALAPLGITLVMEVEGWAGLGKGGKAELWFGTHTQTQQPLHIAFVAENRAQVRAFYAAAIAAGGKDNGPPGVRDIYHPNYYGAFVIGPDGHNIEAVCHAPEP